MDNIITKIFNAFNKSVGLILIIAVIFIPILLNLSTKYSFPEFIFYNSYAILCCIIGIILYLYGFKIWRRKRMIENIPSSNISSLALGLVEVSGIVEYAVLPLKSPITNTNCVFYKIVQINRNDVIETKYSDSVFYINDKTGKILINPKKAELFGRPNETNRDEWVIEPGEEIYVIGTAQEYRSSSQLIKEEFNKKLEELKTNPAAMALVDSNKDGKISNEEWDKAVNDVKEDMTIQNSGHLPTSQLIIEKSDADNIFIISKKSQQELCKILFKQTITRLIFGSYLFISTLIYIILGKTISDKLYIAFVSFIILLLTIPFLNLKDNPDI